MLKGPFIENKFGTLLLVLLELVNGGDDEGAGGDEDHCQGEECHEPDPTVKQCCDRSSGNFFPFMEEISLIFCILKTCLL
jgi:hypothetical protein